MAKNKNKNSGEVITRFFRVRQSMQFTGTALTNSATLLTTLKAGDDSFAQLMDSYRFVKCNGLKLKMYGSYNNGATAMFQFAIGWIPNGETAPTTLVPLSDQYFGVGSGSATWERPAEVSISGRELMGVTEWVQTQDDAADPLLSAIGTLVWLRINVTTTMNHIYEIEGSFSFRGRLDASNISAAVLVREAERALAREGKTLVVMDPPQSVEEAVGEGDKAKEEELLRQLTSIPVVQKLLRDRKMG